MMYATARGILEGKKRLLREEEEGVLERQKGHGERGENGEGEKEKEEGEEGDKMEREGLRDVISGLCECYVLFSGYSDRWLKIRKHSTGESELERRETSVRRGSHRTNDVRSHRLSLSSLFLDKLKHYPRNITESSSSAAKTRPPPRSPASYTCSPPTRTSKKHSAPNSAPHFTIRRTTASCVIRRTPASWDTSSFRA